MPAGVVPSLIVDGAAVGAFILTLAGVGALIVRAIKHTIRDEVPRAMADAIPQVTRRMVREEVSAAVEPAIAEARGTILAELRPNGGSSACDRLNRRMDTLDASVSDLMDAVTAPKKKQK